MYLLRIDKSRITRFLEEFLFSMQKLLDIVLKERCRLLVKPVDFRGLLSVNPLLAKTIFNDTMGPLAECSYLYFSYTDVRLDCGSHHERRKTFPHIEKYTLVILWERIESRTVLLFSSKGSHSPLPSPLGVGVGHAPLSY